MSTSLLSQVFGLKKYEYVSTGYEGGQIKFNPRPKPSLLVCPARGSTDLVKGGRVQRDQGPAHTAKAGDTGSGDTSHKELEIFGH